MKVVYNRPDGGISVLTPLEGPSLEAIIEKDAPKDATNIKVIEDHEVPQDRTYRDAWTHEDGKISVHMPKARDIHRNHLRQMRAPKLTALDVAYMRAQEGGDIHAAAQIAAQKQLLRDITKHPSIEAAQTPDELKLAGINIL